jgi:type II secretory pathway component PulC
MNGERINTPEKMFELFTKWKDASAVTIDIIRRDQKRTVLVEIE